MLTDRPCFQGSPSYFEGRARCDALPALRKDFLFETYQVAEARAWGADCILIILAAVGDDVARYLLDAARALADGCAGRGARPAELDRALALDAHFIGINNRDLRTFETTLETTERLAPRVPDGPHLVGESGIFTHADLARLRSAGIGTFLVGESLMRQNDVAAATRALLTREPARAKSA